MTPTGAVFLPLHRERLVPLVAFDEAVESVDELRALWPGCAVGVRADRAELLVVDVDVKKGKPGLETMRRLQAELGRLPLTRKHQTRSGGAHLIFRAVAGVRSAQDTLRGLGMPAPGVDIVAGRAVIRWVPGTPGYTLARDTAIAELPPRWADALRDPPEEPRIPKSIAPGDTPARKYALAALEAESQELAQTAQMRNCQLVRAASSLGQLSELSDDEIAHDLLLAYEACGALQEHGRRQAEKTIRRGLRWGRAHPRTRRGAA